MDKQDLVDRVTEEFSARSLLSASLHTDILDPDFLEALANAATQAALTAYDKVSERGSFYSRSPEEFGEIAGNAYRETLDVIFTNPVLNAEAVSRLVRDFSKTSKWGFDVLYQEEVRLKRQQRVNEAYEQARKVSMPFANTDLLIYEDRIYTSNLLRAHFEFRDIGVPHHKLGVKLDSPEGRLVVQLVSEPREHKYRDLQESAGLSSRESLLAHFGTIMPFVRTSQRFDVTRTNTGYVSQVAQ